jgi:hypothetical protein
MKLNCNHRNHSGIFGTGLVCLLLLALLAFSFTAAAQTISDDCAACHNDIYQQWKVSGHPYKLMKGDIAQNRPIPLPENHTWDEISYVIGGYKWKSRYMDKDGYIITQGLNQGKTEAGGTQYNMLTDEWVDYNADKPDGTKPYDCGRCHTTGWVADEDWETDGTLEDNQDGLPGIHGTFLQGGIQCIACHEAADGGHPEFGAIDNSADACGACHYRTAAPGDENVIPASNGFIRHHEQYNEHLAGPHGEADCVMCHNPHKKGEFSIWAEGDEGHENGATCGSSCHAGVGETYALTAMADYDVACEDCHMPFASKSAAALGPNQGDVMTHIYFINTDPVDRSAMFTEDGSQVLLDEDGKAAVTLDFACQRCHETASLEELSKFAKDFHDPEIGNTNVGLTPGLSGNWWGGQDRNGEGFLLSFEYGPTGDLILFASFYTYDDTGNQVYLIGLSNEFDGTTVNVDVFITSGRKWGDAFDPSEGGTVAWGTGSFTFPDCESGSMTLMPNADAVASGFTELSYDLSRDVGDLEHGISCPTFVNNAGDAALAAD